MKRTNCFFLLSLGLLLFKVSFISAQEFIPPQARGGERLAEQFVDEEMIYPDIAYKNSVEGKVNFDFVVNEHGSVRELKINSTADTLLIQEALRIFRMIIWQPAQYRGKVAESKAEFEITFNIKHYKRACKERGYTTFNLSEGDIDTSGIIYQYKYTDRAPAPVFNEEANNLQAFLAENFRYPEEALRRNITGIVKLNFIVEPSGHISNLMVIDHVGAGCSEEAIRLIKMLKWKAGIKDGKAVRTNVTAPIRFGLSSDGNYRVSPAAGGTTFQ